MMKNSVIVIGGGAAGMMAAYAAAINNSSVVLLEKNEKLGKKIYITGKGRCNITNMSEKEVVFDSICSNNKFFYSAYKNLNNFETYSLFEAFGLKLKVERGNRVFPQSDHSSDVIKALERQLNILNVQVALNTIVKSISIAEDGRFVVSTNRDNYFGDSLIIATGGLSYPSTGSDGDGYRFAKHFGHRVTELYPSLVSLKTVEPTKVFRGLSLKNVSLSIYNENKLLYSNFGEMLFTDNGISGPLVLTASSFAVKLLQNGIKLKAYIDLKPALDQKTLDLRLLREFKGNENKQLKNVMGKLIPASLINFFLEKARVSGLKQINSITVKDRECIIDTLKALEFNLNGFGGYNEAVITKGGIVLKDMNPKSMESKLIKGLYFAGEILDLDALTGGYNLQIAWSTGYTAGLNAALRDKENC